MEQLKTSIRSVARERTVRSLIRDAIINPKKTATELLKDWKSVRKYSIFGRIAAKKPLLSVRNVRNRFQWCKYYAKVDLIF